MAFVRFCGSCGAFVRCLSGVCHARGLTSGRTGFNLQPQNIETPPLSTDLIIAAARRIKGFEKLPVTAQLSLLLAEIEAARKHRLPLQVICEALNEAGSKVTLRYLREALSVVRKRNQGMPAAPQALPAAGIVKTSQTTKPQQTPGAVELENLTPKEAREQKAEAYVTGTSSNPLLNRQRENK